MTILIADAVISIAVQLAERPPHPAGWIASALPALAFLALTKLVLSRARTATEEDPMLSACPGHLPRTHDHRSTQPRTLLLCDCHWHTSPTAPVGGPAHPATAAPPRLLPF